MTEDTNLASVEEIDEDGLMTPEELALLKKLNAKRKKQKEQLSGAKENLFQSLTEEFAAIISKAKKDAVTVSSKEACSDGNSYAVTFGVVPDNEEESDIDADALVKAIVEQNLSTIEPIMGISNSMKVTGEYEGRKLFWQIRKKA
jgi:hypothetical protein